MKRVRVLFILIILLGMISFSSASVFAALCPSEICTTDMSLTVVADGIKPLVEIISPENNTQYNVDTTASVFVNITSSDINLDKTWFFNGTGNETYTGAVYRTYGLGTHTLTAWANDTYGNVNSTRVVFVVSQVTEEAVGGGPKDILKKSSVIAYCGNGLCEVWNNETATNCPQDCKKEDMKPMILPLFIFIGFILVALIYRQGWKKVSRREYKKMRLEEIQARERAKRRVTR